MEADVLAAPKTWGYVGSKQVGQVWTWVNEKKPKDECEACQLTL